MIKILILTLGILTVISPMLATSNVIIENANNYRDILATIMITLLLKPWIIHHFD